MMNMFCELSDLRNESDVEQFFIIRLLSCLGYEDYTIKTKKSISELVISRGSKKENYKPDYVCFINKKPRLVIDAKDPKENVDNYVYQGAGYALGLNQRSGKVNPVRFFALCNGTLFKLYEWDNDEAILTLEFSNMLNKVLRFARMVDGQIIINTKT